ncbi:phosphatidylserine decarboxylase [Henriciella sp.]|uniref:phosphatidylserine decarboxylase n=1 Tax=Henriciella sp. TaxID=1968823 RepID=UPI0026353529|nr:phosphatidylserine decarboxylase [Henriciella sp.]
MANRNNTLSDRSFPWWHGGFDLEGIIAFLAGGLIGVLLGMLWEPLFLLGFLPGLALLFATRTAERVPPEDASLILAPCDGIVVSIEEADPPESLRMPAGCMRVRISSSPFAITNIHAPIAGTIDHLSQDEGEARQFAATYPNDEGLKRLYFTIGGDDVQAGISLAAGGLGPTLETRSDAGDRVSSGKTIAKRRAGGWCDVFIPEEIAILVEPGQTLIGGETRLADMSGQVSGGLRPSADVAAGDPPPTPETVPPEVTGDEQQPDEEQRSDDPAEMFARLRREAGLANRSDPDDNPEDR